MSHLRLTAAAVLFGLAAATASCSGEDPRKASDAHTPPAPSKTPVEEFTAPRTASGAASNTTYLKKLRRETGGLTPKSVDASGTGLVAANNMIYSHTISFFNAGTKKRISNISDTVDLKDYGLAAESTRLTGGPVEGVWSKDASHYYTSNYVMRGPGYTDEPKDECTGTETYKPSYVYRIDVKAKKIDQVIAAGAVPKYLALTHNEKFLLVSNWCSYSLGIVNLETKRMVAELPIAAWPRGIAVAPDDSAAYVAAYGTKNVYRVDLASGSVSVFAEIGDAARHVTISPDGKYLYAVASHGNTVTKIDRESGRTLGVTKNLIEPRSLTISPDGSALYVVNYLANSVTKLDAATMTRLQVVHVGANPIGITYEPRTGQVWVANYSGSIDVFDDNTVGDATAADAAK